MKKRSECTRRTRDAKRLCGAKCRQLRKPIRMIMRFVVYAVAAAIADLMVICTFLQLAGNAQTLIVVGTCLLLNILLQYLVFRNEIHAEK